MSTRVDALRNTLDHLALDPRASEDRRYLVSMLRRLGYSDVEIEAQIGPIDGGARVIEVEYEPAEDRAPERPLSRETTFEVSAPDDGLSFRLSDDTAPAGAGVEEVHHTDLSGVGSDLDDWGDHEQGPRDELTTVEDAVGEAPGDFEDLAWDDGAGDRYAYDEPQEEPSEELVEFRVVERPDPAVAAGWQEVEHEQEVPGEEEEDAWAPLEEPESDAWAAPVEEPGSDDDAWAAPEEPAWPEPESDAWPEERSSESEDEWPEASEADLAEEPWPEPEPGEDLQAWPEAEAPDAAWTEPEAEELVPWPEATEPGPPEADLSEQAWPEEPPQEDAPVDEAATTAQTAEPAWEEVEEPAGEADAPAEAPEAPYTHGDYTLHTRLVHLSTGREQRIYFFAKNKPQSGEPCPLPDGYEVIENEKTGLPFLRRQR